MPVRTARAAGASRALVELVASCVSIGTDHVEPPFFHVAPNIPATKEARARRVHAAHLPESEPLVALYDDTLLGTASEGFLVTTERICWKNLFQHPRQVPWRELDVSTVLPLSDGVAIAGGVLQTDASAVGGTLRLLVALAERHVTTEAGPYRTTATEGDLAVRRLVALARAHVGEVEHIFYSPGIPAAKLATAHRIHAARLAGDEPIAVLYDDTLLQTARQGFLITPAQLLWNNLMGGPGGLDLEDIDPELVTANGNVVRVVGWELHVWPFAAKAGALIAAAAQAARRRLG